MVAHRSAVGSRRIHHRDAGPLLSCAPRASISTRTRPSRSPPLPDFRACAVPEDVLGTLLAAIDSGRAVPVQSSSLTPEAYVTRTVGTMGCSHGEGRWYLIGHDRDRDDTDIPVVQNRLRRDSDRTRGAVTRPRESTCEGWSTRPSAGPPAVYRPSCGLRTGEPLRCLQAALRLAAEARLGRGVHRVGVDSTGRLAREIAGHSADALVGSSRRTS